MRMLINRRHSAIICTKGLALESSPDARAPPAAAEVVNELADVLPVEVAVAEVLLLPSVGVLPLVAIGAIVPSGFFARWASAAEAAAAAAAVAEVAEVALEVAEALGAVALYS